MTQQNEVFEAVWFLPPDLWGSQGNRVQQSRKHREAAATGTAHGAGGPVLMETLHRQAPQHWDVPTALLPPGPWSRND